MSESRGVGTILHTMARGVLRSVSMPMAIVLMGGFAVLEYLSSKQSDCEDKFNLYGHANVFADGKD